MSLTDQYRDDRVLTRTMVEATFNRDSVPQELTAPYFECYDKETELGLKIAQWLETNRPKNPDTESDN